MKLKVGRNPDVDPRRLDAVRGEIGADVALMVDANGAYSRQEALAWADRYALEWGVTCPEEPVSSTDLTGLRLVRGLNLIERRAVDCLQLDVTRCGGITGFLELAAAAHAHNLEVSAHCAPQLSAHVMCAIPNARHIEWFHDHVRADRELFDGVLEQEGGELTPDRSRAGHGLELRES